MLPTPDIDINEGLYSRQLYVLGREAMKKLSTASVLISGMGGLGVEVAKNTILAGVQSVTVHDTRHAQLSDLASNCYLSETSIGQNRAFASRAQLAVLNGLISVTASDAELTDTFLKTFQCVVITDYRPEREIQRISQFCHTNGSSSSWRRRAAYSDMPSSTMVPSTSHWIPLAKIRHGFDC
jgi:ubiquitin-activating enzyme E1